MMAMRIYRVRFVPGNFSLGYFFFREGIFNGEKKKIANGSFIINKCIPTVKIEKLQYIQFAAIFKSIFRKAHYSYFINQEYKHRR